MFSCWRSSQKGSWRCRRSRAGSRRVHMQGIATLKCTRSTMMGTWHMILQLLPMVCRSRLSTHSSRLKMSPWWTNSSILKCMCYTAHVRYSPKRTACKCSCWCGKTRTETSTSCTPWLSSFRTVRRGSSQGTYHLAGTHSNISCTCPPNPYRSDTAAHICRTCWEQSCWGSHRGTIDSSSPGSKVRITIGISSRQSLRDKSGKEEGMAGRTSTADWRKYQLGSR